MATDREGNTINVGDRVVLVAKIASASGQDLILGNRDPIKVKGEDVLVEAELGGGGGVTDHGALTGLSDPDHPAGAIDFTATNLLLGRATAGAGAGEEIACTAAGRDLLAAVSAAAQRTALDIAAEFLAIDVSNGPLTGDLLVDGGTLAAHKAVVGGEQTLDLYNSASSGASGVRFQIRTRSGSTGDAWFRFENASRYFSIGLDTSEDEFRIGTGATLATGNLFRLTSAGLAFLTAALDMGSSKITSVADGTASDDAATVGQLAALALNDLANVSAGSPLSGDLLQWNGTAWVPYTKPILPTYLVAANNLGDLTSVSSARTNLGLGSAAQQSVAYFLAAGNDLSDLSDAPTARTNLGLGSAAVEAASTFLQGANNLDDLDSPSTALANLRIPAWSDDFPMLDTQLWDNPSNGGGGTFFMPAGNYGPLDSDSGKGWIRVQCGAGTASTDNAALCLDQRDKLGSVLGSDVIIWRFRVLPNRSTSIKAAVGISNATPTSVRPSPSFMFVWDSASSSNLRCQHDDGAGNTTDVDSGVTLASLEDNAVWLELHCSSAGVAYYIDGSNVHNQTTNLPGGSDDRLSPSVYVEGAGAAYASLYVNRVDQIAPTAYWANTA